MSGDGYASILDEEGHMRQDLVVEDDGIVKNLRDKMNSDNDADVLVILIFENLTSGTGDKSGYPDSIYLFK